jgi:hypothetical protein
MRLSTLRWRDDGRTASALAAQPPSPRQGRVWPNAYELVQYALYDAAGTKFLSSNRDDWKLMGLDLEPGEKVFGFKMHKKE